MHTGAVVGFTLGIIVLVVYYLLSQRLVVARTLDRGRGDVASPGYRHFNPQTTIEKSWNIYGERTELTKRLAQQLSMQTGRVSFRLKNFSQDEISFIDNGAGFWGLHLCEGHLHLDQVRDDQVRVTYEINFDKLRRLILIIFYVTISLVALPLAIGIPWLVFYIISKYPNQKAQIVQLVHLMHLVWPVIPLFMYNRSVGYLEGIFESMIVNLKLEKGLGVG